MMSSSKVNATEQSPVSENAVTVAVNPEAAGGNTIASTSSTRKKSPLASVTEVFSFARTRRTKLQMLGAFFFALVSGSTFPGT